MDRIMSIVAAADQIFGIKHVIAHIVNVCFGYRVEVVDDDLASDLITINGEVVSIIPDYDLIPELLPDLRSVEHLIQIPLEPEGF